MLFLGVSSGGIQTAPKMAVRRKNFGEFIFDRGSPKFIFHVSVIMNEKMDPPPELSKTVLTDGDRIVIIPLAGGG